MDAIIKAYNEGALARSAALEAAGAAKLAALAKAEADYTASLQKVYDEAAKAEIELSDAMAKVTRVKPDQAQNAGKAGSK